MPVPASIYEIIVDSAEVIYGHVHGTSGAMVRTRIFHLTCTIAPTDSTIQTYGCGPALRRPFL